MGSENIGKRDGFGAKTEKWEEEESRVSNKDKEGKERKRQVMEK